MNRLVLIFFLGIIIFHPCYNIKKNIKIILFLIGLICILQKSEGFGNIDAEALQNMASLYNSSTGVLKVNNIEASGEITATSFGDITTGNITATGNVTATGDGINSGKISAKNIIADDYGEFGHAYIGKYKNTDGTFNTNSAKWATFCNKHITDVYNHYALIQNNSGRTVLNSSPDQNVEITNNDDGVNGTNTIKFKNGNVTTKGYGEFGNAHIGSAGTPNNGKQDWAEFSHKDHYFDKTNEWKKTYGFYVKDEKNEISNLEIKYNYETHNNNQGYYTTE